MSATRVVIVNADDFGQSPGVNRGIITAHEQGIVTSASLMVRWPGAAEAAAYGREHPELSLGLHLDFGEWACRDGTWVPVYEVVAPDDAAAVAAELDRQFTAFRRLVGRDPTHIDSHQHTHRKEPLCSLVLALAVPRRIPVRHYHPGVCYCGNFYGQMGDGTPLPEVLSVEGLLQILRELPPGTTELGCHPGDGGDLDTMYRNERAQEVRVLCDPLVRGALAGLGIELRSFRDLPPTG
jgi:predicted glycoside hydrolase/deacetylase ChbG (UPF0249 family)